MKILLAPLLALAILALGAAPQQARASENYPPVELARPAISSTWTPQQPLHKGLHLLPATHRHDYGNLRPWDLSATQTITLPASVDLSRWDMPVGDQGYIGSCTSWATSYSLAGWWNNKLHLGLGPFAPMYTYHQVNGGSDNGAWESTNMEAGTHGLMPLAWYPQGNYDWSTAPSGTQMAIASHYRFTGWVPLARDSSTPKDNSWRYLLEFFLSKGSPLALELSVYDNFDNATPQDAWIGPLGPQDNNLGGHVVLAVGYDANGLWIENQWGTGWGLNGYAELSWDYVYQAVTGANAANGLQVYGQPPQPPLTLGAPTITSSIVSGGIPVTGVTTLHDGQEIAVAARGFSPGETVRLYWDGVYRSYLQVWNDGTWQIEWYDHSSGRLGPHNSHPTPGLHLLHAVGESGDDAWLSVRVAP